MHAIIAQNLSPSPWFYYFLIQQKVLFCCSFFAPLECVFFPFAGFKCNYCLYRLWAEVFHVAASGAGQVKWQQVSEDLVPVNITCIQDSPECVFHITAYNSQVDKILDVRLVQPGEWITSNRQRLIITLHFEHINHFAETFLGTRIGQASECFVYWKDPMTNDTWGLNFTSPIDAKQFRECCVSNKHSCLCLSHSHSFHPFLDIFSP